jgi:NADH-quinone oxidoreductase subunit H
VEVTFRARTDSQRELSLELPRAAEQVFCGPPEGASHATFRGDVQVAIAAKSPGAPPVTGSLHGVVLELYPAVKTQVAEDRGAELGRRAVAFFGMEVASQAEGSLAVIAVGPGSRAEAADLRPGDRLLRAGGLSVLQPSDLVPEAARELELGVMRGSLEQTLSITTDGFFTRPPDSLGWAAVMVGAAALGLVGLASPLTRLLGWLVQSAVERRRAGARVLSTRKGQSSRGGDRLRVVDWLGGSVGVLIWLGVAAALLSPVLRRAPVDVSLGLLSLMFGSATLLCVGQLIEGGRAGQSWSLVRGARAALWQSVIAAPAGVAMLAICFETGIDFDGMARAQGALPWQWNAFANPGLLVLFALLLLTALPRLGRPLWGLTQARPPRTARARRDNPLGWLYLCSMCAVAAVAFLGGDVVGGNGGASSGLHAGRPSIASALVLLAKYTALVLTVSSLRRISCGVTAQQWGPISLRVCLPLALLGAAATHAFWALDALAPFWQWLELGFGPASFSMVLIVVSLLLRRAAVSMRAAQQPSLSPWL